MTNLGLNKIEQQPTTLRDMVLERLRDAIIDGVFKPGDRLVERVLCEQLGVSRTVVRETLRYLDAEGLVEHLPNRGPIVARMDWDDARQIYDIRLKLETAAAEACARNMTPDLERRLREALVDLEAAAAKETPGALFKATTRFYALIFEGAGHNIAWEVVQRLNGRISRLRVMTLTSENRKVSGPTHMRNICEAIAARDPDAALAAVEAHLTDATSIAQKLLAGDKEKS
ncbi:GntR family transcriptional regulator [Nitratireductor aquimarinus]|nr:GntR family transcriptional regulator [Nitratireductor aquimarinus]MBN7776509.1 GntR family transcriptional regulator [Nitratireductor pacificus]MBY6002118.1 GntR family transcriptional regulator [Tritonibacter mobilis]MBY6024524.1 GntR family transcriptional regulator [Nitratireductor sp. DP7N14-4]MBN7779376.1 GntR family transcriptional regulator [Nitratireductor pacificus]